MDDIERRERFIIGLKSYIRCMSEEGNSHESFRDLLSCLMYDGITYLMEDVEYNELENILFDLEMYVDSIENLTEEEFEAMLGE